MNNVCPILNQTTEVDQTPFSQGEWSIVKCRETGFVFLANPPEYQALEENFAWESTYKQERERRNADEPIVSRLSMAGIQLRHRIQPKRNKMVSLTVGAMRGLNPGEPLHLLDVGCGSGALMMNMHRRFQSLGRSIVPTGIEISRQLATSSGELFEGLGGRVIFSDGVKGLKQIPSHSIHAGILSCILEHEARPLELLRGLERVLIPGGSVILKVPNFACWNRRVRGKKWCGFRYPDHVNYFTPRTLGILVRESGFVVTRQNGFDKSPISDNMYAVLSRR